MSETILQTANKERTFTSIEEAVQHSRYRERISFLLQNPSLGRKSLRILGGYYEQCSNCFGTTLFIIEGESVFLKSRHCKREDGTVTLGEPGREAFCIFPLHERRPGYVSTDFMDWFLKNQCTPIPQKEKDCIIATTGKYVDAEGFNIGY